MTTLQAQVDALVKEFEVSAADLDKCVERFLEQATASLAKPTDKGLPMLPTYLTTVPTGDEKGVYLAADLGGTNFRVCSVTLLGEGKFDIVQEKWPTPQEVMRGDAAGLFKFLADCMDEFLRKHHGDKFTCEEGVTIAGKVDPLKLGLTFSFPITQTSLNTGTLLRWTKGFDILELVGKDVAKLLQAEITRRKMPVYIAATINDTVGCLMTRAYTTGKGVNTVMGTIFGTGTNAAYVENVKAIKKLDDPKDEGGIMVINTEWGSFDNDLTVLPNTRFDIALDKVTPNKGFHMFEKRVSGLFLGELTRLVLHELYDNKVLFTGQSTVGSTVLKTPFSINTSVPSLIEGDDTPDLTETEEIIKDAFGYSTSLEERRAIRRVCQAIGTRSARLSASALAGLLIKSDSFEKYEKLDIGGDGSVVEFYPHFEERVRRAWCEMATVGSYKEQRITLGIAKDGSGVGAALCALVAP
ncbi:Glucokinase [Wickerhamiella sorbophila]|uniref:Phosphotransferase n=1 Tax=Wickerhamiella sorbophila TaxID=45607 RepID=A0A2T0FLB4_9ASCO|nr:Glucokinase [Wickerhamiella sorbophila]PRT55757.1 Glucokinase [Wickerhamiella sorbophila]